MVDRAKVLKAIGTCHELESAWHNGRVPNVSFKSSVVDVRKVLESLLELKDEYKEAA